MYDVIRSMVEQLGLIRNSESRQGLYLGPEGRRYLRDGQFSLWEWGTQYLPDDAQMEESALSIRLEDPMGPFQLAKLGLYILQTMRVESDSCEYGFLFQYPCHQSSDEREMPTLTWPVYFM